MSELRTYLTEYISHLNQILETCQDDEALKVAAEKRWKPEYPRYLVFLERSLHELRMPISPPDDSDGDVHRGNELP